LNASAQKKNYFLFACAQQSTKLICAEKLPIKVEEIQLTAAEAETYANNYEKQLQKEYPDNQKYKNIQVSLIKQGNVVIQFEGERIYTSKEDGWDCKSTFYVIVAGVDAAAAEKKLAALKADYKRSTYKEIKRWGKTLLHPRYNNDLDVKWVKKTINMVVFLNNSRNGNALKIVLKSLKKPYTAVPGKEASDNFVNWAIIETRTIEIQASGSAQISLGSADAFEIETSSTKNNEPGSSAIDFIKHQIRKFIARPDKVEEIPSMGVGG